MDTGPSPAETDFGDLLRRYRQVAGLTQEELAARTGLSVRGLSDLERGVRALPRKDTLRLLVEALGLTGAERAALVAAAKRRPAPPRPRATYHRGAPDLPMSLTPLVGRDREVRAVCALLGRDDVRLLTLTGAGGVGKTRLALQIAQELGRTFADGVRFVDLAAIRDPALVMTTIAQTLGLREMGGRPLVERLASLLQDKHHLLVLDNFEQVVMAAPQVAGLLAICPRLKVLVTSRAMLHVSGEQTFPVPPLALPDPQHGPSVDEIAASEAVRLFLDRAQAVLPGFALVEANAPTVVAICRRLDGLPLAIELAAARVGHLPLATLQMRLERRLPLLTGGARDQPTRLQTMRDAIAWSYDLLAPYDQQLFRRMAVFAGGCTLEAVETVCADDQVSERDFSDAVLDGLASLVAKSLVWQDAQADEPRYRMLETIREYGLERLEASGEAEVVRRRHAAWCLTLAQQAYAALPGPDRRPWLERSEVEHDNFRSALAWLLEQGDTEAAQRLAAAQQAYAALPGPDRRPWLERSEVEHDNFRSALAWLLEQGDTEAAQRLTGTLVRFWYMRGHLSEGRTWAERALAGSLATPAAVRARAVLAAGWLAWAQGDYAWAEERVHDSLAAFRTLGHTSGVAEGLYVLGMVATDRGDFVQAATLLTEALALFRELGATQWVGFILNSLGIVTYEQGDAERAAALFMESLAQFRTVGETHGTAYALTNLGKIALATGDIEQAAAYYQESLVLRQEHGEEMSVAGCLRGLAIVAAAVGKFKEAASLFGAAQALRERIGLPQPRHHARYEQAVNHCRAALGDEQLLALWQKGRDLSLETAVNTAMDVRGTA